MNMEALIHSSLPPDLYLSERNCLHIRLRAARGDLESCGLVFFSRTSPERRESCRMRLVLRDGQADYYETKIRFPRTARYLKYCFELEGKDGEKAWLNAWGVSKAMPSDGFFEFLYANENDCIRIPDWAKGQVYYQIFPERFCNGDRGNDPAGCVPWGSRPDRESCMGGDLAGIRSKLGYLEELGVQCLYLTPVFLADFNHKYATENYFEVDPQFGTMDELKGLVGECHRRGMRILLDGVFNHCGVRFPKFADVLERQEDSPWKDWFLITSFPVTVSADCYECVGAYPWMPKLNTANPEVRAFILEVMRYWIRETGIDGWRLDVADEVDGTVWTEARAALKEEFPDCLLLGETWGAGQKMMLGNQMDSIMNYGFRDAVRDFIALETMDAAGFDERLGRVYSAYPEPMRAGLYNPLDSHDTPRFLTLCGKDPGKMRMAVALQMLLPGAPAVYYGDEAGVDGENDPDCRKAYPWESRPWEGKLFSWYRELIRLRRARTALAKGDFWANLCEGRCYGFVRSDGPDTVYAVCNAGDAARVRLPVRGTGACRVIFPEPGEEQTPEPVEDPADFEGGKTEWKGVLNLTIPADSVLVIEQIDEKEKEEMG